MPAPTLHGHLPRKLGSAVTGLGNQEPAGSCSSPAISQRCLAVCHLSIVSAPGTKVAPRAAIPGPPQLAQWGHLAPLVSFRVVRDTRGGQKLRPQYGPPTEFTPRPGPRCHLWGPCWVTLQGPPQVCPTLPPFSRTFWKLPGSREEDTPLATCWWTWQGELSHVMVVWGSGGAGGVSPDPPLRDLSRSVLQGWQWKGCGQMGARP